MITARSTRAIVSTACALALALPLNASAQDPAPAEDEEAAAEGEGEAAEGEAAEGEPAEGEDAEGEDAEGEDTEGEPADGEDEPEAEPEAEPEPEPEAEPEAPAPELEDPPEDEAVDAGPERPDEPRVADRPYNGKGLIIAGASTAGVGVAFLATSIVLTKCDPASALACRYGAQRTLLVPSAIAMTGLGITLLAVGLVKKSRYKRWQEWAPGQEAVLAPTFQRGGGGVAYRARF